MKRLLAKVECLTKNVMAFACYKQEFVRKKEKRYYLYSSPPETIQNVIKEVHDHNVISDIVQIYKLRIPLYEQEEKEPPFSGTGGS